ncbi:MAG: hypothetical protein RL077_652 [Verrucomicrobiota bacterium]|jgi:DNA polymerase I-like protein with 3'-5' exonuclease and polymerase domains
MKNSIGTNLRDLRPTNPTWSGFTLWDALQGLDHHVAAGAEALPDLLKPGPGGSGFIALRWIGTKPSGVELSPAKGRLVEVPPDNLTPALLSDLGHLPVLAFNGAEDLGRLAELTGRWPRSYLSLLTMVQVLENGTTVEGDKAPSLELEAVFERYGLPHGPSAGNPTTRLHKLRDILLGRLAKAELWSTYQLESRLLPVTHRMRTSGIGVDAVLLEQVRRDYEARAAVAATELRRVLGQDLNPDDNNAVLAALQGSGFAVKGTSKRDLCRHLDHPAVKALQAYREFQGVHTSARLFLAAIGKDGRIHPWWNAFGAETGRYSCSNPPFQGLSRNVDLRRCFLPRPGFVFVRCDLAQADLRPLASASQDPEMLAIFREKGRDFHRETAARLMNKFPDAVTEEERAVSKAIVFGVVYGMGAESLAEQALMHYGLVWTTEEAQEWMDRFFAIYTGLRAWRDSLWREADTATECRTLSLKRRRFLPTDPGERGYRFRCLLNMPAQGTVADAIKQAMINIAAKLHPEDAIIANFHDELLLEVRAERAEEALHMMPAEMENALASMLTGVPVKTEDGIYTSWAKEPMCEPQPAETTSEGNDQ